MRHCKKSFMLQCLEKAWSILAVRVNISPALLVVITGGVQTPRNL